VTSGFVIVGYCNNLARSAAAKHAGRTECDTRFFDTGKDSPIVAEA
jgi:hypothetical protein